MTAALVSSTREWKWVLPTTDYVVDEDDPALTDDPDKPDEELRGRKAAAKTPATNGIPAIGLSVQDANDAGSGSLDEATRIEWLGNAEMLKLIIIFLRVRYITMTADRAQDVIQDACVRALITKNWPLDASRMTPWLYTIARHAHVDDVRRRIRRDEHEVPRADWDGNEAVTFPETTALALMQILAKLRASEPEIAKGLEIQLLVNAGATVEQAADEHGVSVSTAYELMKNARIYIKAHWRELVACTAIALGMFFVLLHPLESQSGGATGGRDAVRDAALPAVPLDTDPSSLRQDGLRLCERKLYEECLLKLNEARGLDPAGDADPAVGAARKNAEAVIRDKGTK
jgi:DNA-directed RNA polymerase specialized sigma24 family protein